MAAAQHGLITRRQLLDVGLGPSAIQYRVSNGRLHRVHHGVYGVGLHPTAPLSRAMAAVLACGPDAALSHQSAAAIWGILHWRGDFHVTTPRRLRPRGICVHHARALPRDDRTKLWDVPVTVVTRTLIDLCDVLDDRTLARAANEALVRRLVTRDALATQIGCAPGRRARRLTVHVGEQTAPTRSVLEDAFLRLVDTYDLPKPLVNQTLAGHEVDFHWPAQRVVAELDGRAFHDTPMSFEKDRDRDADLAAAGYRPIRITWKRLTTDPDREARRLRTMLG